MRLTFHGAARTVTGSKHLVELESGKKLLLDCGLYQGRRAEANALNSNLPFDASTIDAVLLSHAHIDHSGLLPKLWKDGFRGRVWATHATRDLCSVMLRDSAHIQEKDAYFFNKRNAKRNKRQPEVVPIYGAEDAEGVLEQFEGVDYGQPFSPVEGVQVEYRDAGHILGSATLVLSVKENGKTLRLGFTGDVGSPDRPILRDPQPMPECDWLISESTYGGEVHDAPGKTQDRLAEVISKTASRGGKVIIPAFAVGRTQEIVYALDQLVTQGRLPEIPIFVDSPMAVNATEVYRAHPECYDARLRESLLTDPSPLGFDRLTYVREAAKSKELNSSRFPMVIISASGMCEAGRILHHLRNNIGDSRSTVMMVGYCADHTLGKRIIDRERLVRIFGEEHRVRCRVEVLNSLSAHADEPALIDFLSNHDPTRLRELFLVHGSPERQDALRDSLMVKEFRHVSIPEMGESVELH